MDFDHALRVFRLYCLRLEQDPSDAAKMLLTEREKQAIGELEKVILEYSDLVARKTDPMVTKAA